MAAAHEGALVLNADDPLVADLGRDRADVTYFGVADDAMAMAEMQHAADSKHCRRCGAPYVYEAIYIGHLGHYHCPTGDARRPDPVVYATDVALQGTRSAAFTLHTPAGQARVELPLPGLYNVYNALGAAAVALALGAALDDVVAGLESVSPAFGRAETVALAPQQELVDPAGQEPSRRERGPAHAGAGAGRARPPGRAQRPHRPTAATSPGSGTPTSRCSPAACTG